MAKYSRSALSLRESLAELNEQKAEKFLNTFYFQYGHRSIADLAHIALAIEKLSILAATILVDEPRWDGQERSTRYQDFQKSGYYVPDFDGDTTARELYRDLDRIWNERAQRLNQRLHEDALGVAVANLSSIWTVSYLRPSRYNWMLQYYLRAEGLALSWIGTGRLIFSLNYTEADFQAVAERFVAAARAMQQDGWWWHAPAATNTSIKRRILKEMIAHRLSAKRDWAQRR